VDAADIIEIDHDGKRGHDLVGIVRRSALPVKVQEAELAIAILKILETDVIDVGLLILPRNVGDHKRAAFFHLSDASYGPKHVDQLNCVLIDLHLGAA
jgi:hypothetical protein